MTFRLSVGGSAPPVVLGTGVLAIPEQDVLAHEGRFKPFRIDNAVAFTFRARVLADFVSKSLRRDSTVALAKRRA